jgi:hypothetical protein
MHGGLQPLAESRAAGQRVGHNVWRAFVLSSFEHMGALGATEPAQFREQSLVFGGPPGHENVGGHDAARGRLARAKAFDVP